MEPQRNKRSLEVQMFKGEVLFHELVRKTFQVLYSLNTINLFDRICHRFSMRAENNPLHVSINSYTNAMSKSFFFYPCPREGERKAWGGGREREREMQRDIQKRNMDSLPPIHASTPDGDWTHNHKHSLQSTNVKEALSSKQQFPKADVKALVVLLYGRMLQPAGSPGQGWGSILIFTL